MSHCQGKSFHPHCPENKQIKKYEIFMNMHIKRKYSQNMKLVNVFSINNIIAKAEVVFDSQHSCNGILY